MEIDFDPAKDAANRNKHGVPLSFGEAVFSDGLRLIIPSFREIDGEERFKVIGLVDGRLWTAVYVMRGAALRFISVRKSNGTEAREYADSD
jgi:uncharacterized DUF497 family protein